MSDKKEVVNHPIHYNSHPSNIEAIDVCETMGFNLGNSFKYLYRRNFKKESPIEDIEKAIWYIKKEIQKRNKKSKNTNILKDFFSDIYFYINGYFNLIKYNNRFKILSKINTFEENKIIANIYIQLHEAECYKNNTIKLQNVIGMLIFIKNKNETK